MTNIPTELLRTLVSVVELRSFTRAAHALGVTQPAVSAQIKRLQSMLGGELLDKSAPGVTLTQKGEVVVAHARRLLAINDQILDATAGGGDQVRIGITMGHVDGPVLAALTAFRIAHPHLRFHVSADYSEALIREVAHGDRDLVIAVANTPRPGAMHVWREANAWAAATPDAFGAGPVPLVTLGENSLARRTAIAALQQAGIAYETVYTGNSVAGVIAAVASGMGVTCLAQRHLERAGLALLDGGTRLPQLPDHYGMVLLREGLGRDDMRSLAEQIAAAMSAGEK
jgi:DNA-binding transcriptional LysR family regulator